MLRIIPAAYDDDTHLGLLLIRGNHRKASARRNWVNASSGGGGGAARVVVVVVGISHPRRRRLLRQGIDWRRPARGFIVVESVHHQSARADHLQLVPLPMLRGRGRVDRSQWCT